MRTTIRFTKIIAALLLVFTVGCGAEYTSDFSKVKTTGRNFKSISASPLEKIVDSLKLNKNSLLIKIYKSKYKMEIIHDSVVLKTYPVVFGFNAVDDKFKQGDGCTPEGEFGIRAKYPHKSWSKFIWIDYPNKNSWTKHAKAKKDGVIKKTDAIGGEVGIHGVPAGYDYIIDERQNWTLGCISLKNKDVDDLYSSIGNKTRILVVK